ncbi:DUF2993 domain-containing protein [Geitlerinema sp. PCC 7407]|uniref:LmeA family phospholipid-binding protein n=1 Tax=Geitlerinema sp. PCC 7407 TaxID=1173025 RepID=UPI00029FA2FF|nr:DUF2993 domain-containing protein [Geitlerinema sp. PCC 7407]AFY66939.1 hypothetical protein GEI7407_2464 [Geitlerinema sp. PCC 7407]
MSSESSDFSSSHPLEAEGPEAEQAKGDRAPRSRLISRVLTPAVKLWLRSQVEHIEDLQIEIASGDRQILSGYLPRIVLAARKAIYQGIHLSQIAMTGENIRVNLGQVLRGKPLQLLEPIPVTAELTLQEADFNASLQTPLFANAVIDFLTDWLGSTDAIGEEVTTEGPLNLQNLQVKLLPDALILSSQIRSASGEAVPLIIRTGLSGQGRYLRFEKPSWLPHLNAQRGIPLRELDGYVLDLGETVVIEDLTLSSECLHCQGHLTVLPG